MPFEHRVTARFHEVDRVGIVFFGRVFEYAHIGFEELLTAAFGDVDAIFETFEFGMPLVHAESSYRRPIHQGDRLTVRTTIETLSQRSVSYAHSITGAEDADDLRCTVRLKHAFVSFPAFEPCEVPEVFVEGMRRVALLP